MITLEQARKIKDIKKLQDKLHKITGAILESESTLKLGDSAESTLAKEKHRKALIDEHCDTTSKLFDAFKKLPHYGVPAEYRDSFLMTVEAQVKLMQSNAIMEVLSDTSRVMVGDLKI